MNTGAESGSRARFLDRFNRMPVRHELAAPKELPDAELLCTSSGQVMLDQKDARSLLDVIREYYEERKAKSNTSLAKTYRASQRNVDEWSLLSSKVRRRRTPNHLGNAWFHIG
jgi:DNA-binding IclR family transcriptional regulator